MDQLYDGQHVWLRSLVRGEYLHADEDGRGVSLSSQRATRNAAWAVSGAVEVPQEDGIMLLLQGVAYGRYLAGAETPAQRNLDDEQEVGSITWRAFESGHDDVLLFHISSHGTRYLSANGQSQTGVTMDDMRNLSDMMQWVVEPIPLRTTMPALPRPLLPPGFFPVKLEQNVEEEQWRRREIRYVRADADGKVNENDWVVFQFAGRSVLNLRNELAVRLELDKTVVFIACVRAGSSARLMPLVVDLPLSADALDIVVLMGGTPAIQALRHPNVEFVMQQTQRTDDRQ